MARRRPTKSGSFAQVLPEHHNVPPLPLLHETGGDNEGGCHFAKSAHVSVWALLPEAAGDGGGAEFS